MWGTRAAGAAATGAAAAAGWWVGEWSGGEVGVAAVDDGVTVGARGKG